MIFKHTKSTKVTRLAKRQGFSLVEMMIVTAVMGIMLAIAAPNFSEWIASERVRASANDLYAGLMLGRSEAMKRNAQVNLTRTTGTSTTWEGWSVTLAIGTILQTQDIDTSLAITGPSSGTVSYSYTGRPTTTSIDAQFSVASSTYATVPIRYVCLTLSGMPVVKRCACSTTC